MKPQRLLIPSFRNFTVIFVEVSLNFLGKIGLLFYGAAFALRQLRLRLVGLALSLVWISSWDKQHSASHYKSEHRSKLSLSFRLPGWKNLHVDVCGKVMCRDCIHIGVYLRSRTFPNNLKVYVS